MSDPPLYSAMEQSLTTSTTNESFRRRSTLVFNRRASVKSQMAKYTIKKQNFDLNDIALENS